MKVCQIYNFAPHYRSLIYSLLSTEFDTDFVFGKSSRDLKKMDYKLLNGNVIEVDYINRHGIIYQKGVVSMLFKKYDKYILTGETRNISIWLFLLCAKFFSNKKVYLWTHGWYGKEKGVKRLLSKFFFSLSDGIFLYGDYAKRLMINEGFNKDKLFVVHNSLDYEKHLNLRKKVYNKTIYKDYFKNDSPVLIMIGRLNLRKKMHLLLKAIAKLRDKGDLYNVVFIGDGEDRIKLEKLSEELGISNQTWFYGSCYDEVVNAELIYNADMCVVPGDIGLTAIHVMTFGVPVVTHNYFPNQGPEFETIKKGVTGDFFNSDDIHSLIETIEKWFMINKDREKVRAACMQEIDKSWNPNYQLKIIKEVINN